MKKITLILIILTCILNLVAQNEEWQHYFYNDVRVNAIAEEGEHIWIGTNGDGLIKLDKTTGQKIFYNTFNSGLPDNNIRAIHIDENGNKWIGTSSYLVNYDGYEWITYHPDDYNKGETEMISTIAVDHDGNIWFNAGTKLVKLSDNEFSVMKIFLSEIHSILIDSDNNKWIGTGAGVIKYDNSEWIEFSGYISGSKTMCLDINDHLWIGSEKLNDEGGELLNFDGENWTRYNSENSCLNLNKSPEDIDIEDDGTIWITGETGLIKFAGNQCFVFNSENSSLSHNYTSALFIDSEGNKWLSSTNESDDRYLNYLPQLIMIKGESWINYDLRNSGLFSNEITSIAFDSENNLWVAASIPGSTNYLVKFDDNGWTEYFVEDLFDQPTGKIIDIAFDKDEVWFCTDRLLIKFNGTDWIKYDNDIFQLTDNAVLRSIAVDKQSNKWVATSNGLLKYNDNICEILYFYNSPLPSNNVRVVSIEDNGDIWIGTNTGLAKISGNEWTVYNRDNSGIPQNIINVIAFDTCGNKWIGTNDRGIAKFTGTEWIAYSKFDSELPGNSITSIAIDNENIKWISAIKKGVTRFDDNEWTIYNKSNSRLGTSSVSKIAVDIYGNKWFANSDPQSEAGIIVYNDNGLRNSIELYFSSEYSELNIFPNPVNNDFIVKYNNGTKINGVEVYNLHGNIVSSLKINSDEVIVDMYGISPGVYFVKVYTDKGIEGKKIVKM